MCRIDGEVAEVTVVVQSGFLSVHYPATGAARAGPADPTLSNPWPMPPTGCCSIAVRTRDAQLCKAAARSSGWRRPENAS